MKKTRYIPLLAAAAIFLPMMFVHSCANTTEAPTGGDKDTLPPLIIDIKPLPGAVNFPREGASIEFTFDEYFTIKNNQNIILSPPQSKMPLSKVKGKKLVISFQEPLDSQTTYTLDFIDALADANEGNMFPGYTYVFSTGERIDSMVMTGVVMDCGSLKPTKGATVLLYKDLSDSAVFLKRPCATVKTDDWGFFTLPYLQDTLYRLYAIKDENNNYIYDPDNETVAFVDSILRPVMKVTDSLPELMKYDMTDTLMCEARKKEHTLKLFREKPSKQYLMNKVRVADRTAYITFMAPNVWIDSLWIKGYKSEEIITQFNTMQDSLEIWVNNSKPAPDTLHLFVNYRKTDSLGTLQPSLEHIKLTMPEGQRTISSTSKRKLKHEDTICVYTLEAKGETVEQTGFELEFKEPIVRENFDSLVFRSVNPKQKEEIGQITVERDSMNIRKYVIRPKQKMMAGFDYYLKIPQNCFMDINGYMSDSTEVKVQLPTDDKLSTMTVTFSNVNRKIIIDLLNEKRSSTLRTYIIDSDAVLQFPYLKEGRYSIRVTDDGNRNNLVDTGNLLEHRLPESVVFFSLNGNEYIDIPPSSEIDQVIDIKELFR